MSDPQTERRFTGMLLDMIRDISNELGISEEDQAAANGAAEILIAIRALKQASPRPLDIPVTPGVVMDARGAASIGVPVVQCALTDDERSALLRLNETCEDGEDYDVSKTMMRRLATIGVVQWLGGSRYGITELGRDIVDGLVARQGGGTR